MYPMEVPSDVEKEIELNNKAVEQKKKTLCMNFVPGFKGKIEKQ